MPSSRATWRLSYERLNVERGISILNASVVRCRERKCFQESRFLVAALRLRSTQADGMTGFSLLEVCHPERNSVLLRRGWSMREGSRFWEAEIAGIARCIANDNNLFLPPKPPSEASRSEAEGQRGAVGETLSPTPPASRSAAVRHAPFIAPCFEPCFAP
jgi:hypothetical protein